MRRVEVAERRARLVRRGCLAGASAASAVEVARAVVALHATDPASVFLSIRARMAGATVADVERALYEDRAIVRMLGMRRTMFVVPAELAPVVQRACAEAVWARERRRTLQEMVNADLDGGDAWLARVEKETLAALHARGEALASELTADVPDLATEIVYARGTKWETAQRIGPRVLFLLSAQGLVARGRPRGSWYSTQYRWAPMDAWLPTSAPHPGTDDARAELARRWLHAYGPGTVADLKWWTGLTMAETRRALAALGTVEVEAEGDRGPALLLAGDEEPVASPPEPTAALLPALDPTVMSRAERGWFLGEHAPALFDRSGNAGPTVWWDGRVVGGWAQRPTGEVVHGLLEDVGGDAARAIEREAEALQRWLGPARIITKFRTPLERELTARE